MIRKVNQSSKALSLKEKLQEVIKIIKSNIKFIARKLKKLRKL